MKSPQGASDSWCCLEKLHLMIKERLQKAQRLTPNPLFPCVAQKRDPADAWVTFLKMQSQEKLTLVLA